MGVTVTWTACNKENINENELNTKELETTNLQSNKAANNNFKMECQGDCDCGMHGATINGSTTMECNCEDCVMLITVRKANGTIESFEIKKAEFEVRLHSLFTDYISEKNIALTKVLSVDFAENGDSFSELYTYEKQDGSTDSVLFVKAADKTYEIDCNGKCGCTPQFQFQPPAAKCSCEDCVMTVTEK